MTHAHDTTIAAISSPPGSGARGVLRVSGPRARDLVLATWRGAPPPSLERRGVHFGRFADARGEQPLMLLWMPAPRSFTREDVAEMHLCGAPPLLAAAFQRLVALGAVPAAPGEFTRRAFLSGRIDLARAEGVLALVEAQNEDERRAASELLFGGLSRRVGDVRDALEDLRAVCEASLDFDESDTGHIPAEDLARRCAEIARSVKTAASFELDRSARAIGLPRVVLFGAANAGKSALFNALVGSERALVSDFAGTTRDALEAELDLRGTRVRLCDTAGLAEPASVIPESASGITKPASATPASASVITGPTSDVAERARAITEPASGVELHAQAFARSARESADLVLWIVDASRADPSRAAIQSEMRELPVAVPRILVWSKVDLVDARWSGRARSAPSPALAAEIGADASVATSSLRAVGLEDLRACIALALGRRTGRAAGLARDIHARHRRAYERCAAELDRGLERIRAGAPLELMAEHLRAATSALDEITGETTPEAILDRLFARFCLGK
jgi:tRNA modification GTPase